MLTPTQAGQQHFREGRDRADNPYRDDRRKAQWNKGYDSARLLEGLAYGALPVPFAFAIPHPTALVVAAVEAERRVVELRAITGMDEAEAVAWMTVLSGLQATSMRETTASAYGTFKHAICQGMTPAAAAAEVVKRMRLRDGA